MSTLRLKIDILIECDPPQEPSVLLENLYHTINPYDIWDRLRTNLAKVTETNPHPESKDKNPNLYADDDIFGFDYKSNNTVLKRKPLLGTNFAVALEPNKKDTFYQYLFDLDIFNLYNQLHLRPFLESLLLLGKAKSALFQVYSLGSYRVKFRPFEMLSTKSIHVPHLLRGIEVGDLIDNEFCLAGDFDSRFLEALDATEAKYFKEISDAVTHLISLPYL